MATQNKFVPAFTVNGQSIRVPHGDKDRFLRVIQKVEDAVASGDTETQEYYFSLMEQKGHRHLKAAFTAKGII